MTNVLLRPTRVRRGTSWMNPNRCRETINREEPDYHRFDDELRPTLTSGEPPPEKLPSAASGFAELFSQRLARDTENFRGRALVAAHGPEDVAHIRGFDLGQPTKAGRRCHGWSVR